MIFPHYQETTDGNQFINKTIDNAIWTCFALWILIDSFNGYALMNHMNWRPSQIFKFIVLVIVIARLIHLSTIKKLFVFLLPYIILVLFNSYNLNVNPFDTFTLLMKPLSSFVFFVYFQYIATKDVLYFEKKFWNVFVLSFIFFISNIIIGLLGYGMNVYNTSNSDASFGVKGFLYAQNEMSGLVIYLYPIILYYIRRYYSRIVYYLFFLLIVFISFSIGTKTSLAVAFLTGFMVTYYLANKLEKTLIVILGITILTTGILYLTYLMTIELDIIERFMYFYEKNGLVDAVTSGRLNYWDERSAPFFRMDLITQILGWGNRNIVCEMDPYDAILNFGYIGGLINSLFLLYLIIVPRFWRHKDKYQKIMVFCNALLFIFSIFSGHIFFSSMAGLFIALANARLYTPKTII